MTGEDLLALPVEKLDGIGRKSAEDLKKRKILTLGDLIEKHLPRKYHDYRKTPRIGELMKHDGEMVVVRGQVRNVVEVRRGRHIITTGELFDDTGAVKVTWFGQPYIENTLRSKREVLIHGRFGFYYNSFQISSPRIISEEIIRERGPYVAAYRPVNNIMSAMGTGRIMHRLRGYFSKLPEVMPSFKEYGVWSHFKALYALHFPQNEEQVEFARLRMAFERMVIMYLASEADAMEMEQMESVAIPYDDELLGKIIKYLPFDMTDDQRKAVEEGAKDLEKAHPTNRLIQGDVGSGKTAVALVLAVYVARKGYQSAILAPTSVLASQHSKTFERLFGKVGIEYRLLTGASEDKVKVRREIAEGKAQVVIGTTAVLAEKVEFKSLALAVVDEQQRFGVGQRTALMRGDILPHLISMTATPIPRSLFLARHGNLGISNIKERPAGRAKIESRTAKPSEIAKIHQAIRETLARGEQVYYVCPRIAADVEDEGGDEEILDLWGPNRPTLEREFKELKKVFKGIAEVDQLHGGMTAEEKEKKMWDFHTGKTGILVSTSVIEVGVDNPNATLIVIRGADMFGLSQLHQLRGRVGRSDKESFCYFVACSDDSIPERLVEVASSMDGFRLAEMDLDRRKIGQRILSQMGSQQHGKSELLTNDDLGLLNRRPEFAKKARAAAREFAADDFAGVKKYPELAKRLGAYRQSETVID